MKTDVERKVYSINEAARILGVSASTIRRMIKRNKLSKIDIGVNKVLIPVDEINAILSK